MPTIIDRLDWETVTLIAVDDICQSGSEAEIMSRNDRKCNLCITIRYHTIQHGRFFIQRTQFGEFHLKCIYYTLWMTIQRCCFFCLCFVFVTDLIPNCWWIDLHAMNQIWPIYLFSLYWLTFGARLKNNKSPSRYTDDLQTELLFNGNSQYKRTRVGGSQVCAIEFSTWLVRCQIEPRERWIIHPFIA